MNHDYVIEEMADIPPTFGVPTISRVYHEYGWDAFEGFFKSLNPVTGQVEGPCPALVQTSGSNILLQPTTGSLIQPLEDIAPPCSGSYIKEMEFDYNPSAAFPLERNPAWRVVSAP
jgi:hypothetical protein